MNDILNIFLHQKDVNASTLATTLTENQVDVILAFGGMTNIIELCLTNPSVSDTMDSNSQQFQKFVQLLQASGSNNDCSLSKAATYKNNGVLSTSSKTIIKNNPHDDKIMILRTEEDYNDCKMIIDSNANNSLYFKLIDNKIIAKSIYNIILSKKLVCSLFAISLVTWIVDLILTETVTNNDNNNNVRFYFIIWLFVIYIISIFYVISVGFTANTMIISLILNTFDFWFKIYNLILGFSVWWIRSYCINHDKEFQQNLSSSGSGSDVFWSTSIEMAAKCMGQFCVCVGCVMIFCLDAIDASISIKRLMISISSIAFAYEAIYQYFYTPDYQYNPFNSKYTDISFKSLILSSYINLFIFITKPLYRDVLYYIKNICSNDNNSAPTNHDSDVTHYQRCGTVYKRPYVKWNKINNIDIGIGNYDISNDEQKMDTIVST